MQQTQTYQFNKIDVDDNFSPAPLNENMDKVESALAALDGADAALDARVTVLEAHKLVIGQYKGTYTSSNALTQTINLGFTPKLVFVHSINNLCHVAGQYGRSSELKIIDGGFSVQSNNTNGQNLQYYYYALV